MINNFGSTTERRVNTDHDIFYERKFQERPLYVDPGEFECTVDPDILLVGKVGSGVCICIHDPEVKIGGMMHLIMPEKLLEAFPHIKSEDIAYTHIDNLIGKFINAMKRHGAGKTRIRIKLFGGTSIYEEHVDSGLKNYVFAKDWLLQKGLFIASEDIGGSDCRRIFFIPGSGKIHCYKMKRSYDMEELRNSEKEFLEKFRRQYGL